MSDAVDFEDEEDQALPETTARQFSDAVLYSSDWTVETILSQLNRKNIILNPKFQRRDAWSTNRKSTFIESLVVGLPVPQLVFAEVAGQRGKYLVLDGKQRLLSLIAFTESQGDRRAGFGLSGMTIRKDLSRKKFHDFFNDPELIDELNSFYNYTIRTVIIRNWPNNDFLHQVFLRLNTQSVKLSPQELRQAMAPGPFTEFADEFSAESAALHSLLGRDGPDPRMRDVELLVRFIAFTEHLTSYKGRMKAFLDQTCQIENDQWQVRENTIDEASKQFERLIRELQSIFGENLARKPRSRSFNRAIFDTLSFYAAQGPILDAMARNRQAVHSAYEHLFDDVKFLEAIESDTAGIPNTASRLRIWGEALSGALNMNIDLPRLKDGHFVISE
ncbi:DUF262 domain-containing protein [Acuticoccus yangtzensis]|uniref:DUF262 domain-containing protein n=1 Tax=Acuticoccus yangtzensis TaxID=1443441 RepID=UPI0009497AF2|nr:DUF262 domain-containing protein [Acuticoccus yangtzensis]